MTTDPLVELCAFYHHMNKKDSSEKAACVSQEDLKNAFLDMILEEKLLSQLIFSFHAYEGTKSNFRIIGSGADVIFADAPMDYHEQVKFEKFVIGYDGYSKMVTITFRTVEDCADFCRGNEINLNLEDLYWSLSEREDQLSELLAIVALECRE